MSTSPDSTVASAIFDAIGDDTAFSLLPAPTWSLAHHYLATCQGLSIQTLNQSSAQQQATITLHAVTTMACTQLLATSVASLPGETS